MAKKWTVVYGPFEDETIDLVARDMGWGNPALYGGKETASEYVTRKMHENNTELLSKAKATQAKQSLLEQAKQAEEQVKSAVAALINITEEEVNG